jgi:peptide/nickel transport system ATP-binding protein
MTDHNTGVENTPDETETIHENRHLLLEVNHLKMHFPIRRGLIRRETRMVRAVDDVSFTIHRGETLGLVGESGCGKTTVGRCIVRAYTPTEGEILFREGDNLTENLPKLRVHVDNHRRNSGAMRGDVVDFAKLSQSDLRTYRQEIRMIFQDPYASLNPRLTIYDSISEALQVQGGYGRSELQDRVRQLLLRVGLQPEYMQRYPHAFSGGERQRAVIARALITNPRLIVCDEAVSALDVSVRAQILNLLEELQKDFNLTYLFISHDLSVIRHICNRVVVMYVGKIVEVADVVDLFVRPRHPYTEALLSSVPIADPVGRENRKVVQLRGEIADPANPPTGCYFHPRCRFAQERCRTEAPALRDMGNNQWAACHFAETLDLKGAIPPESIVTATP